MGWKEGETLGKRSEGSILEPILAVERINKNSGFGCDTYYSIVEKSKKCAIAMKTLERYNQGLYDSWVIPGQWEIEGAKNVSKDDSSV